MSFFKRLKEVKLKINLLLLILLPVYFYLGYGTEVTICFISILFHELTHIIASMKYGFEMNELELFPFGGVAKSKKIIWFKPDEEIVIAIVGPMISLLIALISFLVIKVSQQNYVLEVIIKANLIIGGFNLIPLLPLDGGRIIRAFLSKKVGYKLATRRLVMITYVTTVLAMIMGLIMVVRYYYGLYIFLISLFVFLAARKESKMVAFIFIYDIVGKKAEIIKKRVMGTHLLVGLKTVTAIEITKYFLPQKYHIIIVIDNNCNKLGTIHENELLKGIVQNGVDVTLEELLIPKEK